MKEELKDELIDNMQTVDDWFNWRAGKGQSVEQKRIGQINKLKWEYPDVLYSFLGVYTLGIWAYYKDDQEKGITLSGVIIKNKDGNYVYNSKYLANNYSEYSELNENEKLRDFIKQYSSIGNICPTWPGGNEHRGKSCCYDIPDIYFKRHKSWYKVLYRQNPNACLGSVVNSIYAVETSKFLKKIGNRVKYDAFLEHVNSVIEERKNILEGVEDEN